MSVFRAGIVFHPYLLGVFPVLFLYARNVTEMRFKEIFLPLGLILAAVMVVSVILIPIIRHRDKRGLVLSAFLILFFSYGPLVEVAAEADFFLDAETFTPERMVGGGLVMVLAALIIVGARIKFDLSRVTRLFNQLAMALVLIQVAVAAYGLSTKGKAVEAPEETLMPRLTAESTPDIYYIVLDAYARSDILREIYDYDNSEFIRALTARGFYVADSSLANYNSTAQSLTSTLNLNYLHRVIAADRRSFSRMPTAVMLDNNRLISHLRKFGYQTVAFATGYAPTEIQDADFYFSPGWTLSEFQNHLINSTPLPLAAGWFRSQFDLHRERLSYILNQLADLDEVPSPKFVFAHVSCPHPPFVLAPRVNR